MRLTAFRRRPVRGCVAYRRGARLLAAFCWLALAYFVAMLSGAVIGLGMLGIGLYLLVAEHTSVLAGAVGVAWIFGGAALLFGAAIQAFLGYAAGRGLNHVHGGWVAKDPRMLSTVRAVAWVAFLLGGALFLLAAVPATFLDLSDDGGGTPWQVRVIFLSFYGILFLPVTFMGLMLVPTVGRRDVQREFERPNGRRGWHHVR